MPQIDSLASYEKMGEVTLVHEATTFTFSDLDGDYDKFYRIIGWLELHPTTYSSAYVRPNGISSSVYRPYAHWAGWQGSVIHGYNNGAVDGNGLIIHSTSNAGNEMGIVDFLLWAETGRWRLSQQIGFNIAYGGGARLARDSACQWQDSTTNITSLVGYVAPSGHFGAGGILRLYRRRG